MLKKSTTYFRKFFINTVLLFTVVCLILLSVSSFAQPNRQWYPPWPPSSLADEWEIKKGSDGIVLTCFFPYGAVDRTLKLVLNHGSKPDSGTATYQNGHSRNLKDGELNYFWETCGAKHAYEKYKRKAR